MQAGVVTDIQNEAPQDTGTCFYNGTWFKENAELPTRGLCLICHCFKGFTEPNAFTCSVIDCPWDDYHKRFPGCTPIYADRDCCPVGWECDYGSRSPEQQLSKDSNCDCEWRYLKHYEAKGCRPVYEEKPLSDKTECTCPWRFDCSAADEIFANDRACVYKKHVYPVGSRVNTTNPCEVCSCVTDYFTQAATISCVSVECPSVYSKTPLPEGCHYVYKGGECCPVGVECPSRQEETTYEIPLCEYKGKMYYEGEQIYPDEDPCLICLCSQNWTGINSTTCRQHDCLLERDSRKLKQGCIPIYHEKTCCPIDYHCANDDFEFSTKLEPSFKSEDDEDEMCFFEGRYYPIGHVLDIKHPTNCVTCTCKTPPDFTCIHSSCPPPPNNDYVNCRALYKTHSCCPDYTCSGKSSTVCPDPICNGTNCWLIQQENGCAICRCKSRCVPCPDMCQPENPDNECSGCICQLNSTSIRDMENAEAQNGGPVKKPEDQIRQSLNEECKKVNCSSDERCMLTDGHCLKEPCFPEAKCEKVYFGCGQPICPSGCEQIGNYENNCPICYCRKQIPEKQYKITCDEKFCPSTCTLTGRDVNNCPICNCPQGKQATKICPESTCVGYNCTLVLNSEDCSECQCQLPCKPRECPTGCEMTLELPTNGGLLCGCRCKNSSTAVDFAMFKPIAESCSELGCQGYNCTVADDSNGCPICSCQEPCSTPVCFEGCSLENSTMPGRCPGCVCKLSRSARDNTAKECPPPTCQGYNCSVVATEDGCQKCICESPCEESPQCPSHCRLEEDAPAGRCRGCICSLTEDQDVPVTDDDAEQSTLRSDVNKAPHYIPRVHELGIEKREDPVADYIPLPGKDIVPGVDSLLHSAGSLDDTYFEGHAYPIFGENADTEKNQFIDNGDQVEEKEGSYDYMEEKGFENDEKCRQKNCPEGQTCVLRRLQCIRTPCPVIPVCIDNEPVCPIPMCAVGCMVMKWDDEVCPSCFCGIIRGAQGRVCPRHPCLGRRCYNVIGDDGCPSCKCDSICIPPKCSGGCYADPNPPDGKCPTCLCTLQTTLSQTSGTSPSTESVRSQSVETTTSADTSRTPTLDSSTVSVLAELDEVSADVDASSGNPVSPTFPNTLSDSVGMAFTPSSVDPLSPQKAPSGSSLSSPQHSIKGHPKVPQDPESHDDSGFINAFAIQNAHPNFGDRTTVTVILPAESSSHKDDDIDVTEAITPSSEDSASDPKIGSKTSKPPSSEFNEEDDDSSSPVFGGVMSNLSLKELISLREQLKKQSLPPRFSTPALPTEKPKASSCHTPPTPSEETYSYNPEGNEKVNADQINSKNTANPQISEDHKNVPSSTHLHESSSSAGSQVPSAHDNSYVPPIAPPSAEHHQVSTPEPFQDDIFSHHRDKIQIISAALQSHVIAENKHDISDTVDEKQPASEAPQASAVHHQNHQAAASSHEGLAESQQQQHSTSSESPQNGIFEKVPSSVHLSNESRTSQTDVKPPPSQNDNESSVHSSLSQFAPSQTLSRPSQQNQILSLGAPQASREPVSAQNVFNNGQHVSSGSPGIQQQNPVSVSNVPPQSHVLPQQFQAEHRPAQPQQQQPVSLHQQHLNGISNLHQAQQSSSAQILPHQVPHSQTQQQYIGSQIALPQQQQGLQQPASPTLAQQASQSATVQNSQQQSFNSVPQPPVSHPSSVQNIQTQHSQIQGQLVSHPSSTLPQQVPTVLDAQSNAQGPHQSQTYTSTQQSTHHQSPPAIQHQSQQSSSPSLQEVRPASTAYLHQQGHSPSVAHGQQSPSAVLHQPQNQLSPAPPTLHQVHSQSLPSNLQQTQPQPPSHFQQTHPQSPSHFQQMHPQTPSHFQQTHPQSPSHFQQQYHVPGTAHGQPQQVHVSSDIHQHNVPAVSLPSSSSQQPYAQPSSSQASPTLFQETKPQVVSHRPFQHPHPNIITLQTFQQQNSQGISKPSSLSHHPSAQQQQHASSQISSSPTQGQTPQASHHPSHHQHIQTSGSSVYQQNVPGESMPSSIPQHSNTHQQAAEPQISSPFPQENRQQLTPQQTDQPQQIQTSSSLASHTHNIRPGISAQSTSPQHSSGHQQHTASQTSSEVSGGQFPVGISSQPTQQLNAQNHHQVAPQQIPQQDIPPQSSSQTSQFGAQSQPSYLEQATQKPSSSSVKRPPVPSKTSYHRPQQQFYPPLPTSQQSSRPHSAVSAQQSSTVISQQLPSGIPQANVPTSHHPESELSLIPPQQAFPGAQQTTSQLAGTPPVQQNLTPNVSHIVPSAVSNSGIPPQTHIYSPNTSQSQQSPAPLAQPSAPRPSNPPYLESIQESISLSEATGTLLQKPDAVNAPPQVSTFPFQHRPQNQQHSSYGGSQIQQSYGGSQVVPQQHSIPHPALPHSGIKTSAQSQHQSFPTQSGSHAVGHPPIAHQQSSNIADQHTHNLYPQQQQSAGSSQISQFQGTQSQQNTPENPQTQPIPSFQGQATSVSVSHSVEMHELPSSQQQGSVNLAAFQQPEKLTNTTSVTVENENKLSSNLFGALSTASPSSGNGLKPPIPVQQVQTSLQRPFGSYPCPTPHCNGYNCSLIRGHDGCQKCVCDSPCAPCPPHCVKTKTASEGRCPICDCTGALSTSANVQCPTVSCTGPKCRKVKDDKGCYTCVCDPQCETPKCDPGCEILTDVPPGQCPGCLCKVTVVQAVIQKNKQCPPVSCTKTNCKEVLGSDGCPKCFCEQQLCPPPKCDPGCDVQSDVAAGQCPTCVCKEFPEEEDDDDEDDEHYCPNLFCADYGCREVPGPAGCPICHCDPVCRPPVCDPGCKVVSNKYLGRCPVCICSSPINDSSSSVKTGDRTTVSVSIASLAAETSGPADADSLTTTEPTTEAAETTTETTTEEPTTTTEAPTTTTCPPPVCAGLQCRKTMNTNGCVTCKCRFKCPNPRCQGNCYPETSAPPHRCPGCICPTNRRPSRPRSLADLVF